MDSVQPIIIIAFFMYILAEIAKATVLKNHTDLKAVLPYACAIIGAFAGGVLYYIDPTIVNQSSIADSVLSGAISGLLATGANQIYKQFYNIIAVGKATKEEVDTAVSSMTDEERKQYISDVASEIMDKILSNLQSSSSTDESETVDIKNSESDATVGVTSGKDTTSSETTV